jgi:hypothetical protein
MRDPFVDAQFYQKTLVFKSFSTVSTPAYGAAVQARSAGTEVPAEGDMKHLLGILPGIIFWASK